MVDRRTIVLRALNYLRQAHLPTYVGMRTLLERTDPARFDRTIDALISQVSLRRGARLLDTKRYKSNGPDGYLYRDYYLPSPTTALADCYALAVLHNEHVLRNSPDVFSYRAPPDSTYLRNYEYFAAGYRERNRLVGESLVDTDCIAIVSDVAGFYPQVDSRRATGQLMDRVSSTPAINARDGEIVRRSCERSSVFGSDGRAGLRVGLEMSHALANIYLSEFDEHMRTRFARHYFRYVDDVVLVVPRRDARSALEFLDDELARLNLRRNADKDAIADWQTWQRYRNAAPRSQSGQADCLAHLKFRLKLFLARYPERTDQLREQLAGEGVFLPLDQLRAGAFDRGWRTRVAEFFERGWHVVLEYRFDDVSKLVAAAADCKVEVLALLERILERGVAVDTERVSRRWDLQGARFAINRALYFADRQTLRRIVQFCLTVPELSESLAVCEALLGDFRRLVLTPGPATAAAAQLMSLRGVRFGSELERLSMLADPAIATDFEVHLALRDVSHFAGDVSNRNLDLQGLSSMVRPMPVGLLAETIGYGQEVSALALGYGIEHLQQCAKTRYSSREDVVFDALSLDSAYGS